MTKKNNQHFNTEIDFFDSSFPSDWNSVVFGQMGAGQVRNKILGYSQNLIAQEQFKLFVETGLVYSKKDIVQFLKDNNIETDTFYYDGEIDLDTYELI